LPLRFRVGDRLGCPVLVVFPVIQIIDLAVGQLGDVRKGQVVRRVDQAGVELVDIRVAGPDAAL